MIKKRLKIAGVAVLLAGAGMLPFKDVLFKKSLLYKPFKSETEMAAEEESGENIRGAADYYFLRKADLITGMIDMEEVNKVMAQLDNRPMPKAGTNLQWRELGPDNIGGRTRSIVVDKDDPHTLYIGAVSGGVWKSTNGGTSWSRTGGSEQNSLIVTSMVQTGNGDIYYGTGEQIFSRGANGEGASGFIGRGVFKSSDRGKTFEQLKATDPTSPWAGTTYAWNNVNGLAMIPGKPSSLYAATQGGLKISNDAGTTWQDVNTGAPLSNQNCTDVRVSTDGQFIFAVMQNRTQTAAFLYRSKDGGSSWKRVDNSGSTPVTTALSRMVVAIAPSNPNVVYLSAAKTNNTLEGIYATDDAGDNWSRIITGTLSNDPFSQNTAGGSPQGDYDNCISVDPKDPNRFFVGGVHLFMGQRVGSQVQWGPISYNFKSENSFNSYYIHSDKHVITFDTLSKPYVMYIGTDGGVFKSTNVSKTTENPTYIPLNNGYGSIQFYGMGISPTHMDTVIGGTQDNGTLLVGRGGISYQNASSIKGGDGGHAAIAGIKKVFFAESQYGDIQRSLDGKNFSDFFDNNIPKAGIGSYPFVAPFRYWEEYDYDTIIDRNAVDTTKMDTIVYLNPYASKLFIANYSGLYMTSGALVMDKTPLFFKVASWSINPTSVEVSADGDAVFVGGNAGGTGVVYRITGFKNYKKFKYTLDSTGKSSFVPDSNGLSKPIVIYSKSGQAVTGIGVDAKDSKHIVVTLGTYGVSKNHVVMSENALSASPTFTDMSGNLPGFPVYDAAINPRNRNEVIIGTEFGIWYAKDIKTKTWTEENNGMERVPTFMVDFKEYTGPTAAYDGPIFYAATHGRGIFRTETLATVGINDKETAKRSETSLHIYPNPANEMTNLNLSLGNTTDVTITVYNIQGKLVDSYMHRGQPAGERKFNINTSAYQPGTYFVKVSAQGFEKTSKLLVVR